MIRIASVVLLAVLAALPARSQDGTGRVAVTASAGLDTPRLGLFVQASDVVRLRVAFGVERDREVLVRADGERRQRRQTEGALALGVERVFLGFGQVVPHVGLESAAVTFYEAEGPAEGPFALSEWTGTEVAAGGFVGAAFRIARAAHLGVELRLGGRRQVSDRYRPLLSGVPTAPETRRGLRPWHGASVRMTVGL